MVKTLVPNDLRDTLSIISFLGFLGIFLEFTLKRPFLSEIMTEVFLIIGGVGLLILGKAFTIHKWARDGIQRNETLQLLVIVLGLPATIIGTLLLFNFTLPPEVTGIIGAFALGPAVFILFDYLTKNS